MASVEIDSLICKYKYLWKTDINGTLNIESKDGKTLVNLCVEIEDPLDGDLPQGRNQGLGYRNGPGYRA